MLHPTGTACLRDLRNLVYDPLWEYGCGCRKGVRVSTEQNKDLAREAIRIRTTGDLDAADEIYAPSYVNHHHHDPGDPRDLPRTEAMKQFAREFREAFPYFRNSVDIQLAEGDMVATRFTSMGRHRGAFVGVEPTNEEPRWTGITIGRVEDGKIVESWANWDMMGMVQQLGAISPPE
jgi:predicted ester cyclase